MPDREETIQRLKETAALMDYFQNSCRTMGEGVMAAPWSNIKQYALDAAELLKEQEPVEPITQDAWPNPLKMCGSCGWYLAYTVGRPRYCPECGCEVKWDDT